MIVLDVRNLKIVFSGDGGEPNVAVNQISFQLERGKTLGIVGESGSGKSVTALAIMGLLPPNGKVEAGEIYFQAPEGEAPVNLVQLDEEGRRQYRGGKIAMIFQEPMSSLNPVYNIGFQITEAIRLHQQVSLGEARRQAIALLQEVKLLPRDEILARQYLEQGNKSALPSDDRVRQYINQQKRAMLRRYPHQLSGGQLQRVMIAIAISCNPSILLADEPTTALDVTVQATILELLKELCRTRQMSLIFITHDLGVIANIAHRLAVMYRGEIVEAGEASDIFFRAQHPYTRGLLACRPRLDRDLAYLPTLADFTGNGGPGSIPPREALKEPSQPQAIAGTPLLAIEDLRVGFPRKGILGWEREYFWAVNGVTFQVFAGETLGLVGESGCGKSTLARTILRLIPAMEGKIEFLGQNLTALKPNGVQLRNLRREMQIIFQNPYNSLNPRLSIGNAIMEPMLVHQAGVNQAKRRERVHYLLERVGLRADWFNRYPHELSGGQRQRVCIARALALHPQFIICDESVSALDVSIQAQVLNLLKELQGEFGLTYIFISHDLSIVKFMSDRIMVMNRGKIEEIGDSEQIVRHPQQDYTRQLIASIPQFPQEINH